MYGKPHYVMGIATQPKLVLPMDQAPVNVKSWQAIGRTLWAVVPRFCPVRKPLKFPNPLAN